MKFLIPLMILFAHAAFAQPGQVVYIDSLSPEGLLLQKGWQWQASDGSWISVDPTKDIQDSIPLMVKEKVGVIRLYLSLSQKLKNIPLIIQIQHSVAGQYYLNGQKIAEFGKLSQEPNEVIAKDPYWQPIVFPLRGDTLNLLEVHFAVQPDIHYTTVFETANPLVSIYLYDANKGQQLYTSTLVNYNRFEYLLSGICLIIFIIHIAFYLLYKEAIANLYFALSRIVYLAGAVLQNTYWFYLGAVEQKYWIGNIAFAVFVLSFILTMVSAIYYLKRQLDWIDKIFIALYFPVIACIFLMYPNGWRIAAAFEVLIIFNLMRIAILHRKVHKMDATVIGLGALITLIFFALFVASGTFHNNNFLLSLDSRRMVYYIIHALALPVSISIFLAKNFSTMAIRLKKEISHNEMLSTEKQKILAEQNQTLERQVAERTTALKSSQAQLIQSEKLASLGELTAGIAHEIQNPLNFVNNFAEVSAEMLGEMEEELDKGDTQEARAIAADLKTNLEKINHHGKRASSIVKGMLEHSRTSTGLKEPTDLNALADEYLRLAYHGLRAKDSTFNARMETHFDPDLPLVSVIPQDMGRVLLNLINNAFYAVHQRASLGDAPTLGDHKGRPYEPTVIVSTKRLDNAVEIRVQDNGSGIPESIREKIFQPFFTTKPTGQGTGLGLSLAYDIVTKGHGGSLKVESNAGERTEFIIRLV